MIVAFRVSEIDSLVLKATCWTMFRHVIGILKALSFSFPERTTLVGVTELSVCSALL
jgi:hypothetical protein